MKPTNESIEKFKKIFLEEFGEDLSHEMAYEKFLKLINLLRTVLKGKAPAGFDVERKDDKI